MTLPSGLKTSPTQFDEDGNVILPGTVDATVKNVRAPTQPHEAATKGYVDDAIGSAGSSDKIQDAAGTTRVETEEETGRVTTTADGHRVLDVGKDKVLYESEVDPATGTVIKVQRGADLLAGASGHHVTVERGSDVIASTVVAAMPDGEGGVALLNLSAGASTGDLYTASGNKARWDLMVDLQDEVVRTQTEVETEGGSTAIVETRAKDVSGGVWARMGAYDSQDGVLSGVRVDSDGVHAQAGANTGRVIRPGGAELPSGDQSLADWIARVESEATASLPQAWAPTWTGAVNVDGTPVANEGSIKVEGDYVDIEVEVEIESLGSGTVVATAQLPGWVDPPTKDRYGQGTAVYDGSNFIPVLCQLETSGTLTVGLTAAGADVHTACVRLRYKAEEPVQ